MIKIINYRAGNLQNLKNGIEAAGHQAEIADSPDELVGAEKIVLPGVGAFGHAMDNLTRYGFDGYLKNPPPHVQILGVCVGMQLLFRAGFEHGETNGLNLLPGEVRYMRADLKIPHIGWNQTNLLDDDPLFEGIPDKSWFYFVHSYSCVADNKEDVLGEFEYGQRYTSIVRKGNIRGVQFHPEKSHDSGIRLLSNFCSLPVEGIC